MPDFSNWSCPLPLRDYPNIVMGHGGGGKLSAELMEHLILPAFRNEALEVLGDASVLPPVNGRLSFSTDSFVVRPIFFPGGSIGTLAINGTVNDLAMSGATPLYLSAGFILEEGLPLADLGRIVNDMAEGARAAGVQIVTGDTKVVDRGHGDGIYINTAGVGVVREGVQLSPANARPGDVILVSGYLGDHGVAIMSLREGLEFEVPIASDCAPLHELAARVLDAGGSSVRVMRDPTRGGMAASLNEIAQASRTGMVIEEAAVPVRGEVQAACEMLGLDPMFLANEGKMIVITAPEKAAAILEAMRGHAYGRDAAIAGKVVDAHPGMLVSRTRLGTTHVIAMPVGEQLPRIC